MSHLNVHPLQKSVIQQLNKAYDHVWEGLTGPCQPAWPSLVTLSWCQPGLPAPYIAHGGLDDGIEAALRSIAVPGDTLLPHFLIEASHLIRE